MATLIDTIGGQKPRHPEKQKREDSPIQRKPEWIRVKAPVSKGYSATRVEFQVTRWLSLLSSISTLGRQSANVRVSRDY